MIAHPSAGALRVIFFDFGGTLVIPRASTESFDSQFSKVLCEQLARLSPRSKHRLHGTIERIWNQRIELNEAEGKDIGLREVVIRVSGELGISVANVDTFVENVARQLIRCITRSNYLRPHIEHTLAYAATLGWRPAVLSNNVLPANYLGEVLAQFKIREPFEMVLTSGDLELAKPAAAMFHLAATLMGVTVSDCAYVANDASRDQGAKQAGMALLLVIGESAIPDDAIARLTETVGRSK